MKSNDRIFQLVIIGFYVLVFFAISQNLRHQYLWFDESVQFWISKGLNPDSEPLSKPGDFLDVIENNKYYNMDPGGFSILLHFWSKISNTIIWLRLLSFLFFTGIVLSIIYLTNLWLKNLSIALLAGFTPILFPMILNMGFEVRAFTMEALGTVLCVISLEHLKKKINYRNLLFWGLIFSIAITSRYSSIIVVFVTSCFVLSLILNKKINVFAKLISLGIYGLPILISLSFIYFISFRNQNPDASPVIYIQYLKDYPKLLFKPQALLYIGSISFLVVVYLFKKRYEVIKKYESLLLLAISVNLIFILLSFAGKYPWIPPLSFRSNRCISMILLVLLCYSSLLSELLQPLFRSNEVIKYYLISFALLFVLFESRDNLFVRFGKWNPQIKILESESNKYVTNNLYEDLRTYKVNKNDKIYIYIGETPFVKYLYEFGAFSKDIESYPTNFILAKSGKHGAYQGSENTALFGSKAYNSHIKELSNYDVIISDNIPEEGWDRAEGTTFLWVKKID